jgi:hypothetical protein
MQSAITTAGRLQDAAAPTPDWRDRIYAAIDEARAAARTDHDSLAVERQLRLGHLERAVGLLGMAKAMLEGN